MNKYIVKVEFCIEADNILKAIEISQKIASNRLTGAKVVDMVEIKESYRYTFQISEPNT